MLDPPELSTLPYVGPRPYEIKHANRFVGREIEAAEILSLIVARRVLLIYAQSGAGKTSLLNAGLMPLLMQEGFENLPVARVRGANRPDLTLDEIANPYVLNALLSWAGDQADASALNGFSLLRFLGTSSPLLCPQDLIAPSDLLARLRNDGNPLWTFLREQLSSETGQLIVAYSPGQPPSGQLRQVVVDGLNQLIKGPSLYDADLFRYVRLPDEVRAQAEQRMRGQDLAHCNRQLLDAVYPEIIAASQPHLIQERPTDEEGLPIPRIAIFDQFEELFTSYPERWRDREKFLVQVSDALEWDPSLRVVFAMREEYIAQLDPYSHLLPDKLRTRFHLERMDREVALRAIEEPPVMLQTGRSFAPGVAAELVDQLLREQRLGESGAKVGVAGKYVEPVQLQVVCLKLWENLPADIKVIDEKQIMQFGDVDQALSTYYEESLQLGIEAITGRERAVPRWLRKQVIAPLREGKLRSWFEESLITKAGTRAPIIRGPTETGGIPNAAVEIFDTRHLIRLEERAGAPWYELTHDRFIDPIQRSNQTWNQFWQGRKLAGLALVVATVVLMAWFGSTLWQNAQTTTARADAVIAANNARATEAAANRLQATAGRLSQGAIAAQATAKAAAATARTAEAAANSAQVTAGRLSQGAIAAQATAIAAEAVARTAQAAGLVSQATTVGEDQPDLALLLSLEAAGLNESSETTRGLLESMQHKPHLVTFLHGDSLPAQGITFDPDGRSLTAIDNAGTLTKWNVQSRQRLTSHPWNALTTDAAFSADGQTLATTNGGSTVTLWETSRGVSRTLEISGVFVTGLAMSPDGRLLALGDSEGGVTLVNSAGGNQLGKVSQAHNGAVNALAFHPGDSLLASGDEDGKVLVWKLRPVGSEPNQSYELVVSENPPPLEAGVGSLTFSPDGTELVTGGSDGTISLWDFNTGQQMVLSGFGAVVRALAFNPDGRTLASADESGQTILWDVTQGSQLGTRLPAGETAASSLAFNPDGTLLAVSSCTQHNPGGTRCTMGEVSLLDEATGQPTGQRLVGQPALVDAPQSVAFSPDGRRLASAGCGEFDALEARCIEGEILMWDVASAAQQLALQGHAGEAQVISFSPDGRTLASGGCARFDRETGWCVQGEVRLWDTTTGQLVDVLSGLTDQVYSLAFSPDGSMLAWGGCGAFDPATKACTAGEIWLWDVESNQERVRIIAHPKEVTSMAFSSDGRLLASGGCGTLLPGNASCSEGAIMLWDAVTGEPKGKLIGHTNDVMSVGFSPDGRNVASTSADGTILLWDVATLEPLGSLVSSAPAGTQILSQAFSPDNRLLVTGDSLGAVTLWKVGADPWRYIACRMANRNLTETEWQQYLGSEPYRATCPGLFSGAVSFRLTGTAMR